MTFDVGSTGVKHITINGNYLDQRINKNHIITITKDEIIIDLDNCVIFDLKQIEKKWLNVLVKDGIANE